MPRRLSSSTTGSCFAVENGNGFPPPNALGSRCTNRPAMSTIGGAACVRPGILDSIACSAVCGLRTVGSMVSAMFASPAGMSEPASRLTKLCARPPTGSCTAWIRFASVPRKGKSSRFRMMCFTAVSALLCATTSLSPLLAPWTASAIKPAARPTGSNLR